MRQGRRGSWGQRGTLGLSLRHHYSGRTAKGSGTETDGGLVNSAVGHAASSECTWDAAVHPSPRQSAGEVESTSPSPHLGGGEVDAFLLSPRVVCGPTSVAARRRSSPTAAAWGPRRAGCAEWGPRRAVRMRQQRGEVPRCVAAGRLRRWCGCSQRTEAPSTELRCGCGYAPATGAGASAVAGSLAGGGYQLGFGWSSAPRSSYCIGAVQHELVVPLRRRASSLSMPINCLTKCFTGGNHTREEVNVSKQTSQPNTF